jgi:PAS domain S-box-containing protein
MSETPSTKAGVPPPSESAEAGDLARFLVEHSPIGMSLHRASGEWLYASPACARLLGPAAAAAPETIWDTLRSPHTTAEESERLRAAWTQVCAQGIDVQLQLRHTNQAGQALWIELTLRAAIPSQATEREAAEPRMCCQWRDVTADVERGAARAQRLAEAEQAERHRDYLVRMLPGLVWFGPVAPDLSSYRATYMSEYLFRVTGYTAQQWLGTPGFWQSILHPEDREDVLADVPKASKEERPLGPYRIRAKDGRTLWVQSQMMLERDAAGVPLRMYGLTLDMTSFQQAQQERAVLQQELAAQAQRLLELSAPLIPVSQDVLVMPLIGTLDPGRAQHAVETLLAGVRQYRARYVLVDLTGVAIVDAPSAKALFKMTAAVRLLGAKIILTGMRPEIGRTLVALSSELVDITTCASLREAIAQLVSGRSAPQQTTFAGSLAGRSS